MAHRSASHRSVHALARSPLHFRTSIVRLRPLHVYQARQLWWWSRKSFEADSIDDEQERFLRQQRHIRNRYAKIIRRRSMWDRDPSPSTWPWQRRRSDKVFQDLHHLSSSDRTTRRESKDHDEPIRDNVKDYQNDFVSFRKMVDRAIERDTYGALFGRRLWSPPSTNNSSWTSFSWIFEPKEIKEENERTPPAPAQATTPTQSSGSTSSTQGLAPKQPSEQPAHVVMPTAADTTFTKPDDIEYEFDPITMRRVPKKPAVASAPHIAPQHHPFTSTERTKDPASIGDKIKTAPKKSSNVTIKDTTSESRHKTIFDILFGENAVDIPVKTYTPKVYGHDANDTTDKSSKKKPATGRFETSRKREFQALRAATLGNTIDTTAEFFGKYSTNPEASINPQAKSAATNMDDTLFTGTAYEGKADKIAGQTDCASSQDQRSGRPAVPSAPKSSWLEQEGFTTRPRSPKKGFNQLAPARLVEDAHEIPIKKYTAVEPCLNRLAEQRSTKTDRLEPSLDRAERETSHSTPSSNVAWENKVAAAEKAEDIDLLRANDVRASMRADRTTKQDFEERKAKNRHKLERDFAARAAAQQPVQQPGRSSSSAVDHVWKHVEANKDGIVARTIRSMALVNDNLGKDTGTEVESGASLSVKDPVVKSPEYGSFTHSGLPEETSKKALDSVKNKNGLSATAEHDAGETRSGISIENEKLDKLAEQLNDTYQAQTAMTDAWKRATKAIECCKTHPLSTASVKEGIVEHPLIENHIRQFEPAYARLVDEMKDVRRNLHEAKLNFKVIRARRSKKSWSELEAARLAEYADERLLEEEASASGLDEPVFSESKPPTEHSIESLDQPMANHLPTKRETYPKSLDEPIAPFDPSLKMAADLRAQADFPRGVERPTMEEPVFTPSGSPVWNDEQLPPIAELKAAGTEFSSPVVILTYDSSSKSVKAIPSPDLPTLTPRENLNPFSLLAGLDTSQAADFLGYFPRLQNNGYELIDGNKDRLIFHKPGLNPIVEQAKSAKASKETKEAATVLNKIPADVDPPGPYAPIPPTSSDPSSPTRARRQSRVRRQEPVFSGATTAASMPDTLQAAEPISSPQGYRSSYEESAYDYKAQSFEPGVFRRFARTVRRVTLTIFAVAAGAYTMGVIAEGIGAQEQASKGISQADPAGPRKKIVLPQTLETSDNYRRGTRPGIYSTESSRGDQ